MAGVSVQGRPARWFRFIWRLGPPRCHPAPDGAGQNRVSRAEACQLLNELRSARVASGPAKPAVAPESEAARLRAALYP